MALVDASLSAPAVNAAILFFADFADLPIRGAYAPCPLTVPVGLADSDAVSSGFTFDTVNSDVLEISPVAHEDGGTATLQFVLHADQADPDLLTAIENPSLYLGRQVRVWLAIYSLSGATAGEVTELRPLYRGYMTTPNQRADASEYVISMEAENFASLLTTPQARTYLNSTVWDAGDLSGAVGKGLSGSAAGVPSGGRPFGFNEFARPL